MILKRFQLSLNIAVFIVHISLIEIVGAEVPEIACPEYFRYYSDGSSYFGKLTIPNIPPGKIKVEIHLSQIGKVPKPNPSKLSFFESQQDTTRNILNGKPITYRVDFPFPNSLPKLTLISINDAVICSDTDYPAPSTSFKLRNLLEVSVNRLTPYVVRESGAGSNSSHEIRYSFIIPRTQPPPPHIEHSTEASNIFKFSPSFFLFRNPHPNVRPTVLDDACGREDSIITPFIHGGNLLSRGEYPWLTAIYRKNNRDLKFTCGGSLISAKTVISAAHCFAQYGTPANKILVFLGRNNLDDLDEEGSERRRLSSLLLHPEYNANAVSDADIALLELTTPVSFSRYIKPICLWNTATDIRNIVGLSAFTAGWGADESGSITERPKKISTHIADESDCKRSLEEYQTMISSRTICVKAKKENGPCIGDSGGGLAMYTEGRWTLRGIVSAGLTRHGKCFAHEYYYFCDIGKHMTWIERNMWI